MLVALTAVCVTVITPAVGPVSDPLVVLAMFTFAESLSVMVLVAELGALMLVEMPEVTLFNVTMTVSAVSTMASSMTGIEIVPVDDPAGMVIDPANAV